MALLAGGEAILAAASEEPAAGLVAWSASPADGHGPSGKPWRELVPDPGSTAESHLAVRNCGTQASTFAITAADGCFTGKDRVNMLHLDASSVGAGVARISGQPPGHGSCRGTGARPPWRCRKCGLWGR